MDDSTEETIPNIRRLAMAERQRRDNLLQGARGALRPLFALVRELSEVDIPASLKLEDPVSRSAYVKGVMSVPAFHEESGQPAVAWGETPECVAYEISLDTKDDTLNVVFDSQETVAHGSRPRPRPLWGATFKAADAGSIRTVGALADDIRRFAVEREMGRLGIFP